MKRKIIFGTTFLVVFFGFIAFTSTVSAQYTLLENVPWMQNATDAKFSNYITGVYNFLVAVVAICALLMITIGGFYYIMAAGNQAQAGTAKKIITDALLGLVVVFVTWLILYTINEALVNANPNLGSLRVKNTSQKYLYKAQSETHCRNIGGEQKCFNTLAECNSAAGPTAVASSCKPLEQQFDNTKWYEKDDQGNFNEISQEECARRLISGSGNQNCGSGASWKTQLKYSTQTTEEAIEDIKNKSDDKVEIADKARENLQRATQATKDNIAAAAKESGEKIRVTDVVKPEQYTVAIEKDAGFFGYKYPLIDIISKNATLISEDVEEYGEFRTRTTYEYQYPNDYPNEQLAGTKVTFFKDSSYNNEYGGYEENYSDATFTVPQKQNPDYIQEEL